jgi:hypothetical protein
MNAGYEPSRNEIISDMFSKRRIMKLYNDTLEFGRGFGTGLYYTLQFPYNVPTQIRKFKEGKSLVQKQYQKRAKNGVTYDEWDKIIEENVSEELKAGNILKASNAAYDAGTYMGASLGVGIDLVEAAAYGILAISASTGSPKALKFLAPIAVPNIISGAWELYRQMYRGSRQKLIDDMNDLSG